MFDTSTGRGLAMDRNPIYLGGRIDLVNHYSASEEITPGMEIEIYGLSVRPARQRTGMFALGKWGRDVEIVYPIGELVYGAVFQPGSRVWAVTVTIPADAPGQITPTIYLEPNGDGRLKVSPERSPYQALSGPGFSYYTDRSTGALVYGTVFRAEILVMGS